MDFEAKKVKINAQQSIIRDQTVEALRLFSKITSSKSNENFLPVLKESKQSVPSQILSERSPPTLPPLDFSPRSNHRDSTHRNKRMAVDYTNETENILKMKYLMGILNEEVKEMLRSRQEAAERSRRRKAPTVNKYELSVVGKESIYD